jgi:hypothetical protein
MKVYYEYSHLGGSEILQVRYPEINHEIYQVIASINTGKNKVSKEKTKHGMLLYSPVELNDLFKVQFRQLGYQEIRDNYTITIPDTEISIPGAYKQIDFSKEKVNIEVQFGKYAFMFYDMAKFQYFFNENKSDVGVEIVPCHRLHKQMSSGVSYGEQLIYDIERLKRHFPAVPIKIILIDVESST